MCRQNSTSLDFSCVDRVDDISVCDSKTGEFNFQVVSTPIICVGNILQDSKWTCKNHG